MPLLGFEVIVCDPDETACQVFDVPGATVKTELPSRYITANGCHGTTAIVALTHGPCIDDLAMMDAVRTLAFYIGVMGSNRPGGNGGYGERATRQASR